jgi:1-acyl-sn-glycerol-3-phosphate acyltransferase
MRSFGPGRPDARSVARWRTFVGPFVKLAFRPRLEGVDNLPDRGPFMVVANHSGLGLAEEVSLIVCFPGLSQRRIAAMVHPTSMRAWPIGGWMRRLGAIPSTYEAAEAAVAAGASLLVFPGGDHEAVRPVWQAGQVQFAGRKGFLKIARKARLPIVPMGIRGSHYTAPILRRSGRLLPWLLVLPRLLGIRRRYPITLLGALATALLFALGPVANWVLTALLAWLILATPLSHLPWVPWPIRIRIGDPIPHAELFGEGESEGALERAYERVQSAVQELVEAPRPPPS